MKKYLLLILLSSLLLIACSSKEKVKEAPISTQPQSDNKIVTESVDEIALQRALGLELPIERLGYAEKKFNTCEVGYGYSNVNNCRERYFVVIQYQMLCRDSEGTVSEVINSHDLIKNVSRTLRWDLKDFKGTTTTDGLGYSQIRLIADKSQKQQRFKLTIEDDFLYLRAGEVNKIITPRPWCR